MEQNAARFFSEVLTHSLTHSFIQQIFTNIYWAPVLCPALFQHQADTESTLGLNFSNSSPRYRKIRAEGGTAPLLLARQGATGESFKLWGPCPAV